MKFFDTIIRIYLYKIVFGILLIASVVLGFEYYSVLNERTAGLLGGLCAGLIVFLVQLVIQWNEHQDIEQIKKLGIRDIRHYREGKEYYANLIRGSRKEIWVLGNTAKRFLDDFANPSRPDSQSLLEALGRGVSVRILLPTVSYLPHDDRALSEVSHASMKALRAQFSNFEYRYFTHLPAHSIVRVDEECLVGPVFSHVKSKDSPAIHTTTASPFVEHYLKHFAKEWEMAHEG
jgi:hypothetical protein